jgi:hypothetical protein
MFGNGMVAGRRQGGILDRAAIYRMEIRFRWMPCNEEIVPKAKEA